MTRDNGGKNTEGMKRAGIAATILISPGIIFGLFKVWFGITTAFGLGDEEAGIFSIFSVGVTVVITTIYLIETSGGGNS